MTATAEKVAGEKVIEMDMAEDTVTVDKNAVPMESSITSPTVTVHISKQITRHMLTDTRQTQRFSTAKEVSIVTALEGMGRRMMALKVN